MTETKTEVVAREATPAKRDDAAVTQLMDTISRAITADNVDPAALHSMLDVQLRVLDRYDTITFNRAVAAAIIDIPQIEKRGMIPKKGGMVPFARWEDIDSATRPMLRAHGLYYTANTRKEPDGTITVIGTLHHENGKSRSAEFNLQRDDGPGRNATQSWGSSLSYGKRYTFEMLLNIVRKDEDRDGSSPAPAPHQITPAQIQELRNLLSASGKEERAMLAWLRCERLEDMTGRQFETAKGMLMKSIEKAQAQGEAK